MNQIIESLFARKSVRAFTEQEIPEEIVQVILQASTQAPPL
jgi:nitroreductase/FMN reductase (NADPH)/FMN reductase [NAD(P)H]